MSKYNPKLYEKYEKTEDVPMPFLVREVYKYI